MLDSSRIKKTSLLEKQVNMGTAERILAQTAKVGVCSLVDRMPTSRLQGLAIKQMLLQEASQENSVEIEAYDLLLVEVIAIEADGALVLGSCVGDLPELVKKAKQLMLEVNTELPVNWGELLDFNPKEAPYRSIIERRGIHVLRVAADKIACLVEREPSVKEQISPAMLGNMDLIHNLDAFLKQELSRRNSFMCVLQLENGLVLESLLKLGKSFPFLRLYNEVLPSNTLALIEEGRIVQASGSAIAIDGNGYGALEQDLGNIKDRLVLRDRTTALASKALEEFGVIAVNTPEAISIFGDVRMEPRYHKSLAKKLKLKPAFSQAPLSIFLMPATKFNENVSRIVPLLDEENDLAYQPNFVFITEYGVADLRNCTPAERSLRIIENCCHSSFKEELLAFFRLTRNNFE